VADVFISYSRGDSEFVTSLVADLEARGRSVWIDVAGLEVGVVFPEAIRTAIEGSDAFVFVITPESAASSYCGQEVDHALAMNKRVVPVLRTPVPDDALPEPIQVRNWIHWTPENDAKAASEKLVLALDTDLEHVHAHTHWLVKALDWESHGRDHSFLLRGSELAAAEAWLAGVAVKADPPPPPLQREYLLASRTASARRQRRLAVASVAVALVSIGLVIFALISRSQAVAARTAAVSEKIGARSQALAAESRAQLANDPEISLILAMRAVRTRATAQSRFALRAALDASPFQVGLPTISHPGTCGLNAGLVAALSPNGRMIAEGACDGTVRLLGTADGAVSHSRNLRSAVDALAYASNSSMLAAATTAAVVLIDPRTGAPTARLTDAAGPDSVAFSPNGRMIVADDGNGIESWTLPGLRPRRLARSPSLGGNIVFTRNGRLLIVGGQDASVHVYDVATGRLVRRISAPQSWNSWPEVVALSPDGGSLAIAYPVRAADATSSVSTYDTVTWRRRSTIVTIPDVEISSVKFSPDGARIAVGAQDGTAGVWSIPTDQEIVSYDGPTAAVTSMVFTPNGASVLSASNDGVARIWRAIGVERSSLTVALAHGWFPQQLVFGKSALEMVPFGVPEVYSVASGGGRTRKLAITGAQNLILSPDGRLALALASSARGRASVRDVATGRIVDRIDIPWASLGGEAGAFSDDDARVVLEVGKNAAEGQSVILTLSTGAMVTLRGSASPCTGVPQSFVFSGNGGRVAAADFCGYAEVWNARTGALLRKVDVGGEVSAVDLDADGSRLLVSSWDSRGAIYDVATGTPLVNLIGDTRGLEDAAFSPDDTQVVTASLDHTVRVWDARTGQALRVLTLPDNQYPVAFNATGSEFAIAESNPRPGAPDAVRIFDTCPGCNSPRGLLALAAPQVTSQLTVLERTVIGAS
jgi:WD40 repeat protein